MFGDAKGLTDFDLDLVEIENVELVHAETIRREGSFMKGNKQVANLMKEVEKCRLVLVRIDSFHKDLGGFIEFLDKLC